MKQFPDTALSDGLGTLLEVFQPFKEMTDDEAVEISAESLRRILQALGIMQPLAVNLEIELRCFRDMEAGRQAGSFVEDEATDLLSDMLPTVAGNVVKADFGRKS